MWSSHRSRRLVVGEDEAASRSRIEVGSRDEPGCLVRHPVHAAGSPQSAHQRGESTPLLLIQVSQHRRVEDNHGGARRCVGKQPGQVGEQDTSLESGRVGADQIQARSRRSARSICSGQISEVSHRRCSGRLDCGGFRSSPARHTTSGSRFGSGTGPVAAHPNTIRLSPSRCSPRLVVYR